MLISGDLHIGLSNDNPPNTSFPVKGKDVKKRLFELLDVAEKKGMPIVLAGDIFDKENPPAWAHDIFFEFLVAAGKRSIRLIIIPGNHDCGVLRSALMVSQRLFDEQETLNVNLHSPEISIITDEPYVFEYSGLDVCVLPHLPKRLYNAVIEEYGNIKEYVKNITGKNSFDVFITHAHVDGSVSSSETELMESGTAMHFILNDWPKFRLGVFGHVHKHQRLTVKKSNIVYPGSVIMNDYGERKDEKGFVVVEKKEGKPSWSFVPFKSDVTKYKQIKIDLLTKNVFRVNDNQLKTLKGYLLKIIVHTDDLAKVDEIEIRKKFNKYSHVVRFERIMYHGDKISIDNDGEDVIFSGVSYDKLLKTWLDKKEGYKDGVKKLAMKIGKEVLTNA